MNVIYFRIMAVTHRVIRVIRTSEGNTHRLLILARSEGGLAILVINYGRYNHHCCAVLVVEVPEMVENVTTSCLCSENNPEVYEVVISVKCISEKL